MSRQRIHIILLFLFFPVFFARGQLDFLPRLLSVTYDTNYISTYTTDYTARIFSSVKYSMTQYGDNAINKRLRYRPNNKLIIGVGANHGILGINIGFNLPWLNQDDDKYGETKYNDFTLRMYAPRFNASLYLQRYKGLFLRNTATMIQGWTEGDPYYIRGDMRAYTAGLDLTYIFNSERFSLRAAFIQNEWQKKSAGSFLVGGSILYQTTIGDSSLVPKNIAFPNFYNGFNFRRSSNFSIGPIVGYAYTFVYKKHYFLTGAVTGTGSIGLTTLRLVEEDTKVKSGTVLGVRAELLLSAGYNSERWYVGLSYVNLAQTNQAPLPEKNIGFDTGVFRINMVRRIPTKKPIRLLNPSPKEI